MELTLNMIRAKSPCHDGWTKLLKHLGKSGGDDEPLDLLTVLAINGLGDALWVLDRTGCNPRLARHFSAWCAEQVLPLFEAARPGDTRPRDAIVVALDDSATDGERAAAGTAARAAAWDAARDAAWDAARDAAGSDTRDAAWAAAWVAAGAAAGVAAGSDTRVAARAAAGAASWDAQTAQLRKMLVEGF